MAARELESTLRDLLGSLLQLETPSKEGWRLVSYDAEQGITLTLGRDSVFLLIELEPRDDSRECYDRTARFNVCARRQFEGDRELTREHRRVVDQVIEIIREREQQLPGQDRLTPGRRAEVREIEVERVLMEEGAGHYYINPYVGCMIGCEFCYVAERADFSRSLEGLPSLPWGRWVDVKVNAVEVLRQEVRRARPGIVRFSPIVTDPYQPLEHRYRVTRGCLEVLLEAGFTPVVLTRAARVVEDLELFTRFKTAAVGLSIPTDDDRIRHIFEPGGDPIEDRFEALARFHEANVTTFGVVQPILPMDPVNLVDRLAPLIRAVRIDRMHSIHQSLHLYERAGRTDAATDAFFERTGATLRSLFEERGVAMDDLDDLRGALGFTPPGRRKLPLVG